MPRRSFDAQVAFGGESDAPPVSVDVANIGVPTLVVSGAYNLGHFRTVAAVLAREIPKACHIELSSAGHLPSLERPAEINSLLLDFLTGGG